MSIPLVPLHKISSFNITSLSNTRTPILETPVLTQSINDVSHIVFEELFLNMQPTIVSDEEKEWVLIPSEFTQELEEILKDPDQLQKCAEVLVDNLENNWTLIEDDGKPIDEQKKSWLNEWAVTGGVPLVGAGMGVVQQLLGNRTGLSFLQGVNFLKQFEIKTCAYVLPAAPLFIELANKVYQDESEDPFATKVGKATQSMSKADLTFILVSCALSLTTAGMHGALLKAGLFAFDLSGHIMTKTVSSAILAKGLMAQNPLENPSLLKKVAIKTYIASDVLMLHKTALRFHTPSETVAGVIWGLVNLYIAQILASRLEASTSLPLENASESFELENGAESIAKFLTKETQIINSINEHYLEEQGTDETPIITHHLEQEKPFSLPIIEDYIG